MLSTFYTELKRKALEKYFGRMNERQKEAVFSVKGPVLVLAGAGSGKTTVIVNRIANMINFGNAYFDSSYQGNEDDCLLLENYLKGEEVSLSSLRDAVAHEPIKPWNILAITFTNKAAGELKERLYTMLGEEASDIRAATFHSACVRILRRDIERLGYQSSFTIYDSDDSQRVIKACMTDLGISEKQLSPKAVLSEIGSAKDSLLNPDDYEERVGKDYRKTVISRVYREYQKRLFASNAVDFDDIINLTVRILTDYPDALEYYQNRYKYIMVDEYQDTNHAQFRLVSLLSAKHNNLCVVGDDDQSIYSWRGGSNYYLLHFQEMWSNSKIVILPDNFRSVDHILEAANALIANNTNRYRKSLRSHHRATVRPIYRKNVLVDTIRDLVASAERSGYKPGDIAIIARKNKALEKIKKSLDGFYLATSPKTLLIKDEVFIAIRDTFSLYVTNFHDPLALYRQLKRNGYELDIPVERDHMLESFLKYFNLPEPDLYDPDLLEIYEASGSPGIALARTLSSCKKLLYAQDLSDAVRSIYQFLWQKKEHPAVEELCSRIEMRAINTASKFLNHMNAMIEFSDTAEVEYPASPDTITLLTAHKSKGKEFPTVVIYGVEEFEESEEGRNLLYVSMTRAKRNLFLLQGSFSDAPLYPEFKNYVD